jgi:hypothetical protein
VLSLSLSTSRARVVLRGGEETVHVRRGARLLIVNGDIRPHTIDGVTLDRPGAACVLKFPKRGTFTFQSEPGPALVAGLACDSGPQPATIEVVVR